MARAFSPTLCFEILEICKVLSEHLADRFFTARRSVKRSCDMVVCPSVCNVGVL